MNFVKELNPFHLQSVGGYHVKAGDNQLQTCYQFNVLDDCKSKVMTVKMYDKILDLMSREHIWVVGSRFPQILGSKHSIGKFEKTIRDAQFTGITRLEISLRPDIDSDTVMLNNMIKQTWHERIPNLLRHITDNVLNHKDTVSKTFKLINLTDVLYNFGKLDYNCLVIGSNTTWIVNCKTSHRNFFIGTEKKI